MLAFEKAVTGLLTDAQKVRFEQLLLQLRAASNLSTALTDAPVARQLALTPEQTTRLAALWADGVQLQNLRLMHIAAGGAATQKLALTMRDRLDERLLGVLSKEQRAKWKEMTGEPLPGLPKTIPSGRGPGGFGGGFGSGVP